jgi:hypothetical protein
MSETHIVGKPAVASVRTSSLDGHRITTPVPRPSRYAGEAEGAPASAAKAGGQPLHPKTPDVTVGKQPSIDHTTSNTSSRSTSIQQPVTRPGRQPQRPGLVGSAAPRAGSLPADEAELLMQLAQSYHDGLPVDAKVSRALALRALVSVRTLAGK